MSTAVAAGSRSGASPVVAVPAPRLLHGGVARAQARAERPLEVRDERRRREAAVGPPLPGRAPGVPFASASGVRMRGGGGVAAKAAAASRSTVRRAAGVFRLRCRALGVWRGGQLRLVAQGPARRQWGGVRRRWRPRAAPGAAAAAGGRPSGPTTRRAAAECRSARRRAELDFQRRGAYDGTRMERRPRLQGRDAAGVCGTFGLTASWHQARVAASAASSSFARRRRRPMQQNPISLSSRGGSRGPAASRGKNTPADWHQSARGAPARAWDAVPGLQRSPHGTAAAKKIFAKPELLPSESISPAPNHTARHAAVHASGRRKTFHSTARQRAVQKPPRAPPRAASSSALQKASRAWPPPSTRARARPAPSSSFVRWPSPPAGARRR